MAEQYDIQVETFTSLTAEHYSPEWLMEKAIEPCAGDSRDSCPCRAGGEGINDRQRESERSAYDERKPSEVGAARCSYCGLARTAEGHDGCLGTLPGVMNACCGHGGQAEGAYVQFCDGTRIADDEALAFAEWVRPWVAE